MEKRGRPKSTPLPNLDFKGHVQKGCEEQIYELAKMYCTLEEMHRLTGIPVKEITDKYSDTIELGKAECNMGLRRRQLQSAMDGNPTLLIWLGKIILGQKEQDKNGDEVPDHITKWFQAILGIGNRLPMQAQGEGIDSQPE